MITNKTALFMNIVLVCAIIMIMFKFNNEQTRQSNAIEDDVDKPGKQGYDDVTTPASKQESSTERSGDTQRDEVGDVNFEKSRGEPPDWHGIFSFVPYSLLYCNELTEDLPENEGLSEHLKKELAAFEEIVSKEMEKAGQKYGGSEKFIEMQYTYEKLSGLPFIKNVCETGFNAGYSAFVWLLGSNITQVYSFDIGTHKFGKNLATYLQKRFPERLHLTWGNSIETLPQFREEHPDIKCDVMLIDGGHSYAPCQADYNNFRLMANVDNLVILDDYPRKDGGWLKAIGDVWEPAKRRGEVSEIFSCVERGRNHGFAIAHYNV